MSNVPFVVECLGKYMDARLTARRKTDQWTIRPLRGGTDLGVVKWFGRWRQYAFYPASGTIFNPDCMDEISQFARGLSIKHRVMASKVRRDQV